MSDQATAVTTGAEATEAQAAAAGAEHAQEPAQPQAPVRPEAQPQKTEKTGPLSKRDAMAAAREDAKARAAQLQQRPAEAAPAAEATEETEDDAAAQPQRQEGDPEGTYRDTEGRLRHATGPLKGKFAAADGGELPEGTEAATAEERAPDAKPEAKAAELRLIRIDVPEGHAIREMGIATLSAADPQQEQALRALLNGTYTRRQEVDQLRQKMTELQRQLIQQEANTAAQEKWRQTPEYKAAYEQYEEIRDTVGEDAAKRYWQGVVGDLQKITETEFNERWSRVEAEQVAEARRTWEAETFSRTRERLPAEIAQLPQLQTWFKEEVETLDAQIERGLVPHVKTVEDLNAEVHKRLGSRLVSEPAARQVLMRLKDTAQAQAAKGGGKPAPDAAKAVEDFKKSAAQKRVAAPPNPLAAAQHRAAGEGSSSVDTTPPAPDLSAMTPMQRKKHLRQGARQDAARRFGTR